MNIFFISMSAKQCAKWHANIHIVKMIVETAQLLCNVHHRQKELCLKPYMKRSRIPYKDSAAGHRKLGSMIWVGNSLGNYRWAVEMGLELCAEYNRGRGRAAGKTTKHKTQKVLEWLQRHEPTFKTQRRTPVRPKHLAMPDKLKKAATSVECYRDYYYSKRRTMTMVWTPKVAPKWWIERKSGKSMAKKRPAAVKKRPAGVTSSAKKRPAGTGAGDGGKEKKVALASIRSVGGIEAGGIGDKEKKLALASTLSSGEIEAGKTLSLPLQMTS